MKSACPHCHHEFVPSAGSADCCPACGRSLVDAERMLLSTDESAFYEGKFGDTWGVRNPAWWWIKKRVVTRWRFLLNCLPGGPQRILDLGCGGGNALLGEKGGSVIGLDLSVCSLLKARSVCRHVCRARADELPFRDGVFDCVVSMDLLGHIPHSRKDATIKEISRVLKAKGLTMHYVEAAGSNPIQRFAQQYPQLYQRYFIEADGHYGLEPPEAVIERFRQQGFQPVREEKDEVGAVRTLREHLKRFDNEYQTKSARVLWSVRLYRFLGSNRASRYATEGILALVSAVLRRRLDLSSADSLFVCYRKP